MTKLLVSLILLNLTLACGKGFDKKKKSPSIRTQESQEVDTFTLNQEYLTLVNEYRINHKLKPLVYNAGVEEIALKHSKAMATNSLPFGHRGLSLRCRKIKKNVGDHKLCGEIVLMGEKNPKDVLNSWLRSSKHKEELQQNRYNTTALGIYTSTVGVTYWTQILVEL
jgi:uncharacterized protein YkwD